MDRMGFFSFAIMNNKWVNFKNIGSIYGISIIFNYNFISKQWIFLIIIKFKDSIFYNSI